MIGFLLATPLFAKIDEVAAPAPVLKACSPGVCAGFPPPWCACAWNIPHLEEVDEAPILEAPILEGSLSACCNCQFACRGQIMPGFMSNAMCVMHCLYGWQCRGIDRGCPEM